ncbi:MAG: peptide deformylase [Tepidanaerobacteraceae bacterium]|nr:peptide deformylase [Tepidanaerobacteraceae bacterium]
MALRNIREYGEEVLRKKSRRVTVFNERLHMLISDMIDTMKDADGVGLAAPQVGIVKRVIVVDIGEGPIELINPEITYREGEEIKFEGCLSVPGLFGEVSRPKKVKVKAQDKWGNLKEIEGEDLLARALCHEVDHLEGILFVDKAIKFVKPDSEELR